MLFSNSSADYRPLFWVGRYPVSATRLLIGIHVLLIVAYALLGGLGYVALFDPLVYSSRDVLHRGELWRLFTYEFVNAPSFPIFINLFFFALTGEETERFIGRSHFFGLFAALILSISLFLTAWSYGWPVEGYAGSSLVLWGMWIAFVAIYPSVQIFFLPVTSFMLTCALLAILTLIDFCYNQWLHLSLLWFSTAVAALYVRSLGVATGFGFFDRIHEWFESRRMERLAKQNNIRAIKAQEKVESIDTILDKISKHGMGSLTPIEKKILERASADLIKRDKHP